MPKRKQIPANASGVQVRVSTTITAEQYRWVVAHHGQFGAILSAAIRRLMHHELVALGKSGNLQGWLADRNRRGVATSEAEMKEAREIFGG